MPRTEQAYNKYYKKSTDEYQCDGECITLAYKLLYT